MRTAISRLVSVFALLLMLGCADGNDSSPLQGAEFSYAMQGPFPVGTTRVSALNSTDGRVLDVQIWYPAAGAGEPISIVDFALDDRQRDELAALVESAPASCTRRDTLASRDAEPAAMTDPMPLVIFSHCFECTRYSSFTLAERLASHGIAVAAPDHMMNTLFDSGAMLNSEFLGVRGNDVRAVADALLAADTNVLPDSLLGRFDADRLGAAGHSFGAVTTGKVLQDDPRFKAGFIMAAPVENPVITGVSVSEIEQPTLYLIAQEDNSIGEIGNVVMRSNFDAAASPALKVEVADAGHWSFSDIAGLVPAFSAGCGEGERQTVPGERFDYIDNELARSITATYAMRFFALHLLDDQSVIQSLGEPVDPDKVEVQSR